MYKNNEMLIVMNICTKLSLTSPYVTNKRIETNTVKILTEY